MSGPNVTGASAALPLSTRERSRLHGDGVTRLPAVLVIVSLGLALLLPRLAQIRINHLRDEINEVVSPAEASVSEILLAMALEGAARRGYELSGDAELAARFRTSHDLRMAAEPQLVRAARHLQQLGAAGVLTPAESLQIVDQRLDSLITANPNGQSAAALETQHDQFTIVQTLASRVTRALHQEADSRRRDIAATERAAAGLTAVLVLLALGAAFVVYRLGKRFRTLALRLDESNARFRQIAENLDAVIWLSDPDFLRLLYVNQAFQRLLGRARETLLAAPATVWDAIHPDDRDRVRLAMAESRTRRVDIELRFVRPDGEVRWLESRSFPVCDDSGRVFRVAGVIEDITRAREQARERERLLDSERQAREAAEQRRIELERVTESRNRLLRGFTHDVKNPLGAADGYLSLIEEGVTGPLSAKMTSTVSTVRRLIGQGLELVRQLLDIARAEAGQLELHFAQVDITSVVQEAAEMFRPQADAKNLELRQEIAAHLPPVCTDSTRVRQIVGNLVSNAIKYTQPGGQITVSESTLSDAASRDPLEVAIIVTDTGPGIAPQMLPAIFAEFTRLDPRAAEGAGIGLAISRKIARALGGDITVESAVGRGSTFTLRLPVRPAGTDSAPDTASSRV